jgi:hypothetical protein
MKKLLSCIVIGIVVLCGLGAIVTATNQNQKNSEKSGITESPYVDELDQSMTDYDGSLPLGRTNIFGYYANLSIAQSFVPQMEVLTRTFFLMARNASTTHPCFLAIRDNLTAEDLAIISVQPSEFPIVNGTPTEEQLAWIEFNFDDIWVNPGKTYYIVVYTANITENYYWISGNGTNIYPNGTVYLSMNDGQTWTEFPGGNADGCFKTYGLRETFLNITINRDLFGPSFVIKNIGNFTAWDLSYNITINGGILRGIHKTILDNSSELTAGNLHLVRITGIFGLGAVTISLQISAANVHEQLEQIDAKILLIFWIY